MLAYLLLVADWSGSRSVKIRTVEFHVYAVCRTDVYIVFFFNFFFPNLTKLANSHILGDWDCAIHRDSSEASDSSGS